MDGRELAGSIRRKADEFKKACEGIDEATASRAPEGRWSPKEIVSHLIGPDGGGMIPMFKAFLEQDTPKLDLEAGNAHFTGDRAQMSFKDLIGRFEKEYSALAAFVAGLSPAQLDRKAYIPELKESPMGEYPSLGTFVAGLVDYHIGFHVDHMREILEALGKS
jgi:hypothetical protein